MEDSLYKQLMRERGIPVVGEEPATEAAPPSSDQKSENEPSKMSDDSYVNRAKSATLALMGYNAPKQAPVEPTTSSDDVSYKEMMRQRGIPIAGEEPESESFKYLKNLGLMAGQGLSYNQEDEIIARAMATKEMLQGNPEKLNWDQLVDKNLKDIRSRIQQAKTETGAAGTAAEFTGALFSPVNKILAPIKFARAGKEALSTMGAGAKALEAAKPVVEMAAGGALGGAISGFGASEATLAQPEKLLTDIKDYAVPGAMFGGGLGLTSPVVQYGISPLAKKLKGTNELFENLINSFETGLDGLGFFSKGSQKRIEDLRQEVVPMYADTMMQGLGSVSVDDAVGPLAQVNKEFGKLLDGAHKAGAKILPTPEAIKIISEAVDRFELNNALRPRKITKSSGNELVDGVYKALGRKEDVLPSLGVGSEMKTFFDHVEKFLKGEMSAKEGYEFGKWLSGSERLGELRPLHGSMFADIAQNLPKLGEEFKNLSGAAAEKATGINFEALKKKFRDVREKTVEMKGESGDVGRLLKKPLGEYNTLEEAKKELYDKFNQMIENVADPSRGYDEIRTTIRDMRKNAEYLDANYPDLNVKQKLFPILDKFEQVGSQLKIREKIVSPKHGADTVEGMAGRILEITGYGAANLTGRLLGLPKNSLMPVAQKLKASPNLAWAGQEIENAITNKNNAALNAVLFSILQNPEARTYMNDFFKQQDMQGANVP